MPLAANEREGCAKESIRRGQSREKKKGYVMLAKHEQKVRFRMRIRCTLCIIVAKKLLGGVANRARRGRICPF